MNANFSNWLWAGTPRRDWKVTRLKRVAAFSPSFSDRRPEVDEDCTVVPMEAVSELGELSCSLRQPFNDVTDGLTLFENGDVLFAKITPCMENGKGAYVEGLPTRYAFGSTEFHVMRPSHRIDGRFLYYCTFNPHFRTWAEKNMHGAAGQQRVSARFLKYTDFFLPPLPEQRLIAPYLDASCASIDRAVASKQQQLDTLDALRKSIIQRAVTQGLNPKVEMKDSGVNYLGQIPKHWRVQKLKRLVSEPLAYGLNEPGTEENPEWPRYIRITDFGGDGKLRDETFRSLPPEVANTAPLVEGDILLARSGATVGKSFLFTDYAGDACYAGYLIKVRTASHLLMPDFLYQYTRSYSYEDWKNLIFTQATIQNISATKYGYLEVPVPPLDEQPAILDLLRRELARSDSIQSTLEEQISTLTAYRKSLIHECVTGQRRITEADVAHVQAHV